MPILRCGINRDRSIRFEVEGTPKGEPRPRITRHGTYVPNVADEWKRSVRRAAVKAIGAGGGMPWFPKGVPVAVELTFALQRPLDHFKARSRERELKKASPAVPCVKPDVDNLAKAVLDALGVWPKKARPCLWEDDIQVARLFVSKVYSTNEFQPGIVVEAYALTKP